MNPRPVALWTALLPFAAVHLTYLLAASHELVPWCLPYIDSCTSISATGRHPPASYLFRATMLPAAVLIMAYWWLNHAWLASLAAPRRLRDSMLWLGVLAGLGLVAYVSVLGEVGQTWARQRRAGTVLFFSFTFLAQLLLAAALLRLRLTPAVHSLARWILRNCGLLLLLGLLTVLWDALDPIAYDRVEDAFEWLLSLLLQVNFLLGYLVWRRQGWWLAVHS